MSTTTPVGGLSRNGEAASAYARRFRWFVFPVFEPSGARCACGVAGCSNVGKHPRTERGVLDASTDPDAIRQWWTRWPDANIGIACGPSGLVVLDVDGPEGEVGLQELGNPPTVCALTAHGRHLYFRAPEQPIANRVRIRPGLDVRASGGYVIAPRSRHASGARYLWDKANGMGPNQLRPAPLPPALLALLTSANGHAAPVTVTGDPIPEGERDHTLTRLAGRLYRKGLAPEEVAAAVRAANETRCTPPLPDRDVLRIVGSIGGREQAQRARNGARPRDEPDGAPPTDDDPEPALEPAPEALARSPFTDTSNAARFAEQHGDRVRYVPEWKTWLTWDGCRWAPDRGETLELAKGSVLELYRAALAEPGEDARKRGLNWAIKSDAEPRLRAMLALAASIPELVASPDDFDQRDDLLNCPNGVLDLRTSELRPHDPALLFTKVTAVPFDPGAACPRWLAFLAQVTGPRPELIPFLQRLFGYGVTGHNREQKLAIIHGPGSNGKSSLLAAIRAAVGDYGSSADMTTFLASSTDRTRGDLARLAGLRLVVTSEVTEGRHLDEPLLKNLTGGDAIVCRRLYQNEIEYTPKFLLVWGLNDRPEIHSVGEAMWRRLLLVPFDVTIPPEEQDHGLGDALRAEGPGILAWLADGAHAWYTRGLEPPDSVTAAVATYRRDSDVLGDWLEECCTLDPAARTAAAEAYAAYVGFVEANRGRPVTAATFGKRLAGRPGISTTRGARGKRFYNGLRLQIGDGSDSKQGFSESPL